MQNESARCFELGSPTLLGSTIAEVLVEHFRFSPESSDAMCTKSITHVCKHSLRTQINRYDQRTEPERRTQALCYHRGRDISGLSDAAVEVHYE